MSNTPVILWFRRDLRLHDNPALIAAYKTGAPIIPLFILEEGQHYSSGGAARWWLHHSLKSLGDDISAMGNVLILRKGNPAAILDALIKETGASCVFWNRRYHQPEVSDDKTLKADLTAKGVDVNSFNGNLLREPWEVKTGAGHFYKVFSPFWKALRAMGPAREKVSPKPKTLNPPTSFPKSDSLKDWSLLPTKPDWATGFTPHWSPGEQGAKNALSKFLNTAIDNYDNDRNIPHKEGTSKLSPHLAFGEISPLQIWTTTQTLIVNNKVNEKQATKFLSEVAWREFSYVLLYHYPTLATEPLKPNFKNYPWVENETLLTAWQKGQTGYPIVDAGMRELWTTGWMHNRVRMIVASFLIKHLQIPWQAGERWFWDTLVDADIANNAASWQWVAGCGADAAPYFRIFNPFGQGEKFDPDGAYVRQYVPELEKMPAKFIHQPWTAPLLVLQEAGVNLGENYPEPIVDHAMARQRALDGYQSIKGQ